MLSLFQRKNTTGDLLWNRARLENEKDYCITFLFFTAILNLSACGKETASVGIIGGADGPTAVYVTDGSDLPAIKTMQGTVTEIHNDTMLVTPAEGAWELSSSDCFSVPVQYMEPSSKPRVGDVIEIIYDGSIEETDPATLHNIMHIEVVGTAVGGDTCPRVAINGITYFDRGNNPLKAGLPPADFSVYEEAEIPVEGAFSGTASTYAVCDDAAYLLINGEWYEFTPELCEGVPPAPEGFTKP